MATFWKWPKRALCWAYFLQSLCLGGSPLLLLLQGRRSNRRGEMRSLRRGKVSLGLLRQLLEQRLLLRRPPGLLLQLLHGLGAAGLAGMMMLEPGGGRGFSPQALVQSGRLEVEWVRRVGADGGQEEAGGGGCRAIRVRED